MSENTTTPTIDSIEETNTPEQKYVCFVKRRPGGKFIPYTEPEDSNKVVVRTLRQFLDHQISEWYKAGEKEQPENRPLLKISLDDFAADIHANGMNAKLVSILGWNYPQAIRMAESEGTIFLLGKSCRRFPVKARPQLRLRRKQIFNLKGIFNVFNFRRLLRRKNRRKNNGHNIEPYRYMAQSANRNKSVCHRHLPALLLFRNRMIRLAEFFRFSRLYLNKDQRFLPFCHEVKFPFGKPDISV